MLDYFDNLGIGRKFALVAALALPIFAVPTLMLVRANLAAIETARVESDGMPRAAAMLRAIQFTQQHRAASAGSLGGTAGMQARQQAKQAEVDEALAKVAADAAGMPAVAAKVAEVRQHWAALSAAVADRSLDAGASNLRHTDLVAEELQLLRMVVDAARLSMDAEDDTHHALRTLLEALPQLSESLGRIRAFGTPVLQKHEATPAERARLAGLAAAARTQRDDLRYGFEQFRRANAAAARASAATLDAALPAVDGALKLLDESILQAKTLDFAAAEYVARMTQAIDSQFALVDVTFKSLDALLAQRVAARQRELAATAGAIAVFGALAAWLALVVIRRTTRSVARALATAQAVANGDLTTAIAAESRDEIGQLLDALGRMNASLARVVTEVRSSSENIATGTAQIATGNADLSQRTEQQASNLQQTAASMEELGATVRHNASTAQQATEVVGQASAAARRGGEVVAQVVDTMEEITASSRKIADIIGVIDSIAFQTNILALNATVEAARAGEQGRGFAVVASEVRSLAQRSAGAAREIKALITASGERVQTGSRLVNEAGAAMSDIVAQVSRANSLIGEISDASQQQAAGISQVGGAVSQLDSVTQQNAALVEESAAAADSLSQQAARLVQAVGVFRLKAA